MTGGALHGLRVVEVGTYVAAPFAARLLADLGAEVVKVEAPAGDPLRRLGPGAGDGADAGAVFAWLHAGKAEVTLDLDDRGDRERLDELLAGADVLCENTMPAERARWGLDFDDLATRHPHLVAVSLSPYGRSGPWAERPGTDLTAQAASSLPLGLGMPEREPIRIPYDQADFQTGLHAAAAALCALHEQRRSGRGQGVDVSTAHVMGYQVGGMYLVTAKAGRPWERRGTLLHGAVYPTGFFPCRDGFICIASQTAKQWQAFLKLMGDPKWAKDDAHARDAVYLGMVDQEPADVHFRDWLMRYTRAELLEMAMAERIVLGVAQTVDEVLDSPQLASRDLWADVGGVRVPKPGYRLSATPSGLGETAPALSHAEPEPAQAVWADGDRPREGRLRRPGLASSRTAVKRGGSQRGDGAPPLSRGRALEGVRILDFGWNWAGPMAGQLLADMGAEVIRIETSKRQDLMRFVDYTSWFFCHTNRSKKSALFNVALPEGAEMVRRLAATADVVMDNFAAGVMAKNGLAYADLKAVKDDVVVVSMSMAGQEGPLRDMRGFASIATGYSGLELMVGYPEDATATGLLPFGLGDTTMAIQGVIGTLAALRHRDETGEGQFVDVSQIDSAAATMGEALADFQLTGNVPGAQGNRHPWFFPHGVYAAAGEERWVALAVRDGAEWAALCGVLGRPEWGEDSALASAAGRPARGAEIEGAVGAWCAGRDRDRGADTLAAAGVPAAPVLELAERDAHPQFAGRGFTWRHDAEGWDPCTVYATPWVFTETPAEMVRPTPLLGEHSGYVYRDLLGLGDGEIARLRADKALL